VEAIFFRTSREVATTIRSIDDLEDDPATEPLGMESPGAVVTLVSLLSGGAPGGLEQLRDATCQSFPVWSLSATVTSALGSLTAPAVEELAVAWKDAVAEGELDTDLYELTICLEDLRRATEKIAESGEDLFVLFEEKALF
jgi:hypothetical protein